MKLGSNEAAVSLSVIPVYCLLLTVYFLLFLLLLLLPKHGHESRRVASRGRGRVRGRALV